MTSEENLNWVRIFNRLFEIINRPGDTYYKGPKFISKVQVIDPYFHNYSQYIEKRTRSGKSTSRRDYFYDILLGFDEDDRISILRSIIADIGEYSPTKTRALEIELGLRNETDAPAKIEVEPTPENSPPADPPTYMYHETKCPDGQIFGASEVASLVKKGWVDSPAKFGKDIRSKSRNFGQTLSQFWLEHWKWIIGTTVAIAAVVVSATTG